MSRLSQSEAAAVLGVTAKTVQNWEQGVSRIPYSAFKLLRILRGYELPHKAWEGWTVRGDTLNAPNGRQFDAQSLAYLEQVFAMSRLWQQTYRESCRKQKTGSVVQFPSVVDAAPSGRNRKGSA